MRELHRQNFTGLVAVEYEKEGDVDSDMKQDVEYCPTARLKLVLTNTTAPPGKKRAEIDVEGS